MPVPKDGNADARQTRDQFLLRLVDDDEIGSQREDAFEVGVHERADARPAADLGRVLVETRHAHDGRACADGEEHLSDGWDERDDS